MHYNFCQSVLYLNQQLRSYIASITMTSGLRGSSIDQDCRWAEAEEKVSFF